MIFHMPNETVLVNGDLAVQGIPRSYHFKIGEFLIYRTLNNQNWFYGTEETKLKATEVASFWKGHVIEIKSIER